VVALFTIPSIDPKCNGQKEPSSLKVAWW
jgi:hypothetical protein